MPAGNELPPGWTMKTKTTPEGRQYRMFYSDDGLTRDSSEQAWMAYTRGRAANLTSWIDSGKAWATKGGMPTAISGTVGAVAV